jgi:WD40 repeat protein
MISALSFSPDGRLLIAGGFDETTFRNPVKVQFWDVAAGSVVRTADSPHRVTAAVFSADGSWAATATGSKEVQVWKAPRPGQ